MSAIYRVYLIRFLCIKDKAAYDLLIAQCSVEKKTCINFCINLYPLPCNNSKMLS